MIMIAEKKKIMRISYWAKSYPLYLLLGKKLIFVIFASVACDLLLKHDI